MASATAFKFKSRLLPLAKLSDRTSGNKKAALQQLSSISLSV